MELIDCATSYLLYEYNIEIVRFNKAVEFGEYLNTLTRLIADRYIGDEHVSEIDCVTK